MKYTFLRRPKGSVWHISKKQRTQGSAIEHTTFCGRSVFVSPVTLAKGTEQSIAEAMGLACISCLRRRKRQEQP